jgi:hypothetical protein
MTRLMTKKTMDMLPRPLNYCYHSDFWTRTAIQNPKGHEPGMEIGARQWIVHRCPSRPQTRQVHSCGSQARVCWAWKLCTVCYVPTWMPGDGQQEESKKSRGWESMMLTTFVEVVVGCSGTRKQNTSPPTSQKWTQAKDAYNKLGRLFRIPTVHDTNARSLCLAAMCLNLQFVCLSAVDHSGSSFRSSI